MVRKSIYSFLVISGLLMTGCSSQAGNEKDLAMLEYEACLKTETDMLVLSWEKNPVGTSDNIDRVRESLKNDGENFFSIVKEYCKIYRP